MSTRASLLHKLEFYKTHLVSFDLYVQNTLHRISKHNLILRTNQVIYVIITEQLLLLLLSLLFCTQKLVFRIHIYKTKMHIDYLHQNFSAHTKCLG